MNDSESKRAVEIYFDGDCPVCRREIAFFANRIPDEQITWSNVAQSGEAIAPDLERDAALARFHARTANGDLVSGARAFFALWRNIGALRPLANLMDRRPFIWVAEALYRGFLLVRKVWHRPKSPSRTRSVER